MKTERSFVGARGIDSLGFSQSGTASHAAELKAAGTDFVVGYLGAVTAPRAKSILDAGMAFMPVTFADQFDGGKTVAQCMNLGLTSGVTVWLDVEGPSIMEPVSLVTHINEWADAVTRGGYQPGLYVGSPQPLSSVELYNLKVVRYWNALSREADRTGALAEPKCGYCMWQMYPSRDWGGQWCDMNMIGADYYGRLPSWVVA